MMNELVSVIIPLYNHASLIKEAIESVLSQTYSPIEIIVVDDGSTDDPKSILMPYITQGQISYIYQPNQGLSTARNRGLKQARGKYIKFLDSDDYLYPEQIEKQVEKLKGREDLLSTTDHFDLRPNGEVIRRNAVIESEEAQLASFMEDNRAVVHSFLAPRSLIEKVGGFDESLTACEDWDLWVRILKDGASIAHVNDVGCCYRISATSMSSDMKKMFLQTCKVKEKVNSWYEKKAKLPPFTEERLLASNVKLIEEAIARGINLKEMLPHTLSMTDFIFQSRKQGPFKALFQMLGIEKYCLLRFYCRKFYDSHYEYKILNEVNFHRYGQQYYPMPKKTFPWPLLRASLNLNKGIVLMYHRIAEAAIDPWQICVSPRHFEQHMQILAKYGRPMALKESVKNLKRFNLGKKEIIVSFDDGYADNFYAAKPILEKYGIPAIFYITTDGINNTREFWWDELERLIFSGPLPDVFCMFIESKEYYWVLDVKGTKEIVQDVPPNRIIISKLQLYYALWKILRPMSIELKWKYLYQIAQWAGHGQKPRLENLPMSAQQISILAQSSLFEIGAHTVHHPVLNELSIGEQSTEIKQSKETLEKIINKPVTQFSYPHGKYSRKTIELLKSSGFESACTTEPKPFAVRTDPFQWPRFTVFNWDAEEFEEQIASWVR